MITQQTHRYRNMSYMMGACFIHVIIHWHAGSAALYALAMNMRNRGINRNNDERITCVSLNCLIITRGFTRDADDDESGTKAEDVAVMTPSTMVSSLVVMRLRVRACLRTGLRLADRTAGRHE